MNRGLNSQKEIEEAFKAYYKELCLYALSFVEELDIAEDIVQDVFVKILTQKKDMANVENPRAYLYYSIRNSCLNYLDSLKRKQKNKNLYLKQLSNSVSIEETMIEAERKIVIYKAIDKLPTQCKKAFTLCTIDDLKYKEAAEEMNISINSVKTQMKQAFKKLRAALNEMHKMVLLYSLL